MRKGIDKNFYKKTAQLTLKMTRAEKQFWKHLSKRTKLKPQDLMLSVLRRHMKSRYIIARKEWYYVYGKAS